MPRGWPPLDWQEITACLSALGFVHERTSSSHQIWTHHERRRIVTVDTNWRPCSGPTIRHLVIDQAGVSREAFYRATKATAKKI